MLTRSFITGLHAKFHILPQVSKNAYPNLKEEGMSGSTLTVFTFTATKAKAFSICSVKRDHVNPIARLLSICKHLPAVRGN